jgi:spermidine synthase
VKPWQTLSEAPLGSSVLALRQRGDEFLVLVDGRPLMGSRRTGSEEALAEVGLARLATARPSILVGGLGFGYTLRAALDASPPGAEVVVAELSSAVVEWNRGVLAELAGRPLDDARVRLEVADVARVVRARAERFDVILLDVDNGPFAVAQPQNAELYGLGGLASLHRALRPGGRLVVWSAGGDARFLRRMNDVGFEARATPAGRGRHVLFVGDKAAPARRR